MLAHLTIYCKYEILSYREVSLKNDTEIDFDNEKDGVLAISNF